MKRLLTLSMSVLAAVQLFSQKEQGPEVLGGCKWWIWNLSSNSLFCHPPFILCDDTLQVCRGDTVILEEYHDCPYSDCISFQWGKNGIPIPGATSNIYAITIADTGLITLTVDCFYYIVMGPFTIVCNGPGIQTNPTNTLTNQADEQVNIFPNPSAGKVTIQLNDFLSQNNNLKVYNALGQSVFTEKLIANTTEVDISRFDNGVYVFAIDNGTTTVRQRILKSGP